MSRRLSKPFHMAPLVLAICLCTSAAVAKPPKRYQPVGAPADPKVVVRWNHYHDYQRITAILKSLAAAHPERARLQSLGKSHDGREMWLLTITNFNKAEDRDKPAFWIDGAIHANEVQGSEVTLYTAWYLLEMYGRSPLITELVDRRAFYLLPMMSPDSRHAHMYRPNSTHSPRSGQVPVDDDRDGRFDEDGPDDLDGDGHITQMRIRDENGRFKPHPDYPHLLVRAEADQPGEYTLLGTEGFDNDDDGRINEDGDGFYDPNRDWAWHWQPGHVQRGAYRYPFSIPENRLVADFVADHPNIAGAQSYHNTGGMILRGPGDKDDRYESGDLKVYQAIAAKGELVLPDYRYLNVAKDLYQVHGGELDWFYSMRGVFTFSNELFTSAKFFGKPRGEGYFGSKEEKEVFSKYLLFDDGIVAWQEVDHPQYGKVEVGGLKKQWGRQPPSFLLEEECHRNMAFTLYHADQMPLVEIQELRTDRLSGSLMQVTAVVANRRVTPTRAAVDVKRKITVPDLVTLEGKEIRVVTGLWAKNPFFRKAVHQKRHPERLKIETIGGMSAVYVRWLIEGQGPFTVKVKSAKGGSDQRDSVRE